MTDAVREGLAPKDIHVAALHVGYMDTDMVSDISTDQEIDPGVVATLALDDQGSIVVSASITDIASTNAAS